MSFFPKQYHTSKFYSIDCSCTSTPLRNFSLQQFLNIFIQQLQLWYSLERNRTAYNKLSIHRSLIYRQQSQNLNLYPCTIVAFTKIYLMKQKREGTFLSYNDPKFIFQNLEHTRWGHLQVSMGLVYMSDIIKILLSSQRLLLFIKRKENEGLLLFKREINNYLNHILII